MTSINYDVICREVAQYKDQLFNGPYDGSVHVFVGILIAPEDFYYELVKVEDNSRVLLSMVGSIEGHGFVPLERF